MNFLAHAYLSGGRKKILIGNFAGDFFKGRQTLRQCDPEIARGVELHRAIDAFTDAHPVVHESKSRLRAGYRHYAGVITDVFYDHFLAKDWHLHHSQPLESFAASTYETLSEFSEALPADFNRMLPYMIRGNWLVGYRDIAGVHSALSGMASRTPYESRMEYASNDLKAHHSLFRQEFRTFFPELRHFVEQWLEDNTNTPS